MRKHPDASGGAPASSLGAVKVWSAPLKIPTFEPQPADRNPMFLEKRVYQGSQRAGLSAAVHRPDSAECGRARWDAVHIENEFLRVMVLPELGGRIHAALDKTNGYDFVYRNRVIKPALVGLAGPWISGGIEFNWPQHHRPATFMPADVAIEEDADGGGTVWLERARSDGPDEGHARRLPAPRQAVSRAEGPPLQPHRPCADLSVVGQRRDRVHERYQSFLPARRAPRRRPRQARHEHVSAVRAAATTASTMASAGATASR